MVPQANTKMYVRVPRACTVTGWDIVADISGSAVVDVWKDTYANWAPNVSDSIAGSEKPTLSGATSNTDNALLSWSDVTLDEGDYIGFNLDSVSTCKLIIVTLKLTVP